MLARWLPASLHLIGPGIGLGAVWASLDRARIVFVFEWPFENVLASYQLSTNVSLTGRPAGPRSVAAGANPALRSRCD